jgi:hypothetical protein
VTSRAAIRLVAVHIRLLLKGWPDTYAAAQSRLESSPRPLPSDNPGMRAQRIATLVDAIAARLPFATCLRRSLVLWELLAQEGISSEIQLGVQRLPEGKVEAHAWVVQDGTPLNQPWVERLAAFNQPLAAAAVPSMNSPTELSSR